MIRQAIAADCAAIDVFLAGHAETSMFLRNNLAQHGIGVSTHPHASTYWIETTGAKVTGVLGKSNSGYLMIQAPEATPEFLVQIAKFTAGCKVRGMTGVPEQVDPALGALGLADLSFAVNKDEPLYSVVLDDVVSMGSEMRLVKETDHAFLSGWFAGYLMDTGLTGTTQEARDDGKHRAEKAIGNPDVMLLIENGEPAAMAGINARVADLVQVGGVYTPPAARGKGLARRAVSGLLEHQKDAVRSILFAADRAAARAYEAIGFKHIGAYRVAMLRDICVLEGKT